MPLIAFADRRIIRMIRSYARRQEHIMDYDNQILQRLIAGLIQNDFDIRVYLDEVLTRLHNE